MATYKVTPSSAAFYAALSGVSTYATTSGVSTTSSYATTAGIATNSTNAGYASTSGISTVAQGLTGTPDVTVGILTASSTIIGSAVTITPGGVRASGIVTASSFRPSSGYIQAADGTNSIYIYSGTGNISFQGTIGASQINNASGNKVIGFAVTDITFENNANVAGVITARTFLGQVNSGVSTLGVATATNLTAQQFNVSGVSTHVGVSTFQSTIFGTQLNLSGIATVGLGTTSTPQSNSQLSFELTSNTNLRIKVRGTDGVLRSANITLA